MEEKDILADLDEEIPAFEAIESIAEDLGYRKTTLYPSQTRHWNQVDAATLKEAGVRRVGGSWMVTPAKLKAYIKQTFGFGPKKGIESIPDMEPREFLKTATGVYNYADLMRYLNPKYASDSRVRSLERKLNKDEAEIEKTLGLKRQGKARVIDIAVFKYWYCEVEWGVRPEDL